jgi:serine/threonine-protein kinase
MIGKTVGHYRIVSLLGRGASGTVYRAVDETLGRDVALKILHPDRADSDAMTRFHAEATILARLNHAAITTIYELFWADQDLVMVMELVAGVTLDRLSDRYGPMAPDRAAVYIDQILSALAHAHQKGVVHRDMKPANVMVTEARAVKVMDFGIARMRSAEQPVADGSMMGTPAYMPPEQILNEPIDGRADIYSVGVIFYRLLTGVLPFEGGTPVATLQRQISEPSAPMTQYRSDLPEWCDTIVRRALAKSPADRFQTADEFRHAIAEASGTPIAVTLPDVLPVAPQDHVDDHRAAIERTLEILPRRKPLPYVAVSSIAVVAAIVVLSLASLPGVVGYALPAPEPVARPKAAPMDMPAAADVTPAQKGAPAVERILSPEPVHGAPKPFEAPVERIPPPEPIRAAPEPSELPVEPIAPPEPIHPAPVPSEPSSRPLAKARPPNIAFETKTLVGDGFSQRTRDARMLLTHETVDVRSNDPARSLLYSVAYDNVTSITYSYGARPMSYSANGAVAVRRNDGMLSSLGIFVERHWIALATNGKQKFIVLRVEDRQVDKILSALRERTGLMPHRLAERKWKRES